MGGGEGRISSPLHDFASIKVMTVRLEEKIVPTKMAPLRSTTRSDDVI